MRLGISSFTYNWWAGVPGYPSTRAPLTAEKLFQRALKLGVDVVQIADNLPLHDQPLPSVPSGLGVEIGTRGIRPEGLLRYLEIARQLGSPILRTLLDGPNGREAIAMLRDVIGEFEDGGVTLAIENHDRLRARELRLIVDEVGSASVGVCLDTANSLGCGEGIEHVLDWLAGVTVNLHVKDIRISRLPHNKGFIVEGAPAGEGIIDIPGVLKRVPSDISAIVELWSSPCASLEESIAREDEWAERSVAYMRTLIAAS